MDENELSREIIGAAIEVHKALGPGLLESAYEVSLKRELDLRGFKEEVCDIGYRVDLLVDGKVVIEIKSVEALTDVHVAQVLTYLKLSECKLGLLINFNVARLTNGIRRLVNKLEP